MFEASWVAVLGLDNSKSNELIGRVQPSFLQLIRETSTGVHALHQTELEWISLI